MLELNALRRSGPFLHVHHRDDECYDVLSGDFVFKAGDQEFSPSTGGSIWLPRVLLTCTQINQPPMAN